MKNFITTNKKKDIGINKKRGLYYYDIENLILAVGQEKHIRKKYVHKIKDIDSEHIFIYPAAKLNIENLRKIIIESEIMPSLYHLSEIFTISEIVEKLKNKTFNSLAATLFIQTLSKENNKKKLIPDVREYYYNKYNKNTIKVHKNIIGGFRDYLNINIKQFDSEIMLIYMSEEEKINLENLSYNNTYLDNLLLQYLIYKNIKIKNINSLLYNRGTYLPYLKKIIKEYELDINDNLKYNTNMLFWKELIKLKLDLFKQIKINRKNLENGITSMKYQNDILKIKSKDTFHPELNEFLMSQLIKYNVDNIRDEVELINKYIIYKSEFPFLLCNIIKEHWSEFFNKQLKMYHNINNYNLLLSYIN